MLVLVGLKVLLLLLLLGPWAWGQLLRSPVNVLRRWTDRNVQRRVAVIEDSMRGRRRASVARSIQASIGRHVPEFSVLFRLLNAL